jgi:hypothetical protein
MRRKVSDDCRRRGVRLAQEELERCLREEFEAFMERALASEKWFLWQVFLMHETSHKTHEESCEFGLAGAFEDFIGRRGEYLRIEDEKLYDEVARFIRDHRQ